MTIPGSCAHYSPIFFKREVYYLICQSLATSQTIYSGAGFVLVSDGCPSKGLLWQIYRISLPLMWTFCKLHKPLTQQHKNYVFLKSAAFKNFTLQCMYLVTYSNHFVQSARSTCEVIKQEGVL